MYSFDFNLQDFDIGCSSVWLYLVPAGLEVLGYLAEGCLRTFDSIKDSVSGLDLESRNKGWCNSTPFKRCYIFDLYSYCLIKIAKTLGLLPTGVIICYLAPSLSSFVNFVLGIFNKSGAKVFGVLKEFGVS